MANLKISNFISHNFQTLVSKLILKNLFQQKKIPKILKFPTFIISIQIYFQEELTFPDNDKEMAHKKITGICEKIGIHKNILEYPSSLNPNDLLLKKGSS